MKKTTLFIITITAFTFISLSYTSCKKDDAVNSATDDDASSQTQQSADESYFQIESENTLNEVNTAVSGSTFAKTAGISGATIDDSTYIGSNKIVITYNGTSADGRRNRTGEIVVQLVSGANWGEAGAVLRIDFNALKITQVASGKSIMLKGYHLITNTSGGRVSSGSTITHSVRGVMSISFDNTSATRSWQVARKRTIAIDGSNYTITVEGDTSLHGFDNIVVWGANRYNDAFYTQITTPVVLSSTCPGKIISGAKVHKGILRETTVTFGVDASGNPVAGTCPYGFRINWTNIRNITKTAVISY